MGPASQMVPAPRCLGLRWKDLSDWGGLNSWSFFVPCPGPGPVPGGAGSHTADFPGGARAPGVSLPANQGQAASFQATPWALGFGCFWGQQA